MFMPISFRKYLLLMLLFLPPGLLAQKTDTLKLACLLNDAIELTEKQAVNLGQKELKLVLASSTDTLVKSCADVVISTIGRDADDGTWEVLFQHKKNYWFWLSGLNKVVVKKDQKIKTGEVIGHLEIGKKIELLLYDFETPLDPKKYMNCGKSN